MNICTRMRAPRRSSQLLMVRRTLDQQTVRAAKVAADFGVSERYRAQVVGAVAGGRRAGPQRPQLGARAPAPAAPEQRRRDRGAAAAEVELARDRPPPRPAALDRPHASCAASVWAASKSLDPPAPVGRYQRQEPRRARSTSIPRSSAASPASATVSPAARSVMINLYRGIGWEYLHVAVDDATRLAYTRDPARRTQGQRHRLPRAHTGLVRAPRRHCRADHDRQRQCLPQPRLPQLPAPARSRAAPAHQALYAAHQRQGRALHPDRHARMRLCPRVPIVTGAGRQHCPARCTSTTFTDHIPPSLAQPPISRLTMNNLLGNDQLASAQRAPNFFD